MRPGFEMAHDELIGLANSPCSSDQRFAGGYFSVVAALQDSDVRFI